MCDWTEEKEPFKLPITEGSFTLLREQWRIPPLFLSLIRNFNIRAHRFSAGLGGDPKTRGISTAEQS
jgi:hypothetical protein